MLSFDRNRKELLHDILNDDQLAGLVQERPMQSIIKMKRYWMSSVVGGLFDKQLTSSASRLSTFAACPYRHFARYVLDLKKRDEFKLEPLDLGDFYHRVLDGFIKRVVAEKIHFETITDDCLD